jgi:hypothetical protein
MEPRAPALALASIALPILMAALWVFFDRHPQIGDGLNGYLGMFIAIFLYLGTLISVVAGLFLSIASLVRERIKVLGVVGIIANCILLLKVHG